MMRIAVAVALMAILAFGGEWGYRSFIRPIDPLPPEIVALAEHFDRSGIKVSPYAVRHDFRHSEIQAVAAFKIADFPIPFIVFICPDLASAKVRFEAVEAVPNRTSRAMNGRLVLDLNLWADDDKILATKVVDVFNTFDAGAMPREP
jgi:hypothetical protein